MLYWFLGCLPGAERPISGFHDDAGFLVSQMQVRGCTDRAPCVIWDAGLFADGPQAVGLGRPCAGSCITAPRDVRVLGHQFDGVTGMLAPENPLLVTLHALGCTTREACRVAYDRGAITLITHAKGGASRVSLPGD